MLLLNAIRLLLCALGLASIAYYLGCLYAARRFFSEAPGTSTSASIPPVTVLIPLCGVDFKALDNYASFCMQEYPDYQLVFGVQDPNDSSIPVIGKLRADFPERAIDLVISSESVGENPKVSNLNNMLRSARHEVIVVADSDIRVGKDYLASIVSELCEEKVGLVTCLYRAGEASTIPTRIEALGIATGFAPGVLMADLIEGISFALGATMAFRRERLQAIGGFEAIADYLADDFMLGQLIHRSGYRIRLSRTIVETIMPRSGMAAVIKHQIRWARGIRACRPSGHFGSLVTHGTAIALVNAVVSAGAPSSIILLAAIVGLRFFSAWYIGGVCLGDGQVARNLWMILPGDLLSFGIWCTSLFGKRVEWRGTAYRLSQGGRMERAD